MFIRRTRTNNTATGEDYFTFRLVRGERIAGKVRQITVLNLGRHFPIAQEDWSLLCSRIEQLLAPQALIAAIECPGAIERAALRYYAKLRAFDALDCASTKTVGGETVRLQKVLSEDGQELELRVHSLGREEKERAMFKRFCDAFEAGLQKIADGLNSDKPRSEKRVDKLQERIGRLKQKSRGVSQHYQITLSADESGKKASALSWK